MSYDGRLGFGLLADFDALPDLEDIAAHLEGAIDDLARAAGADDRVGRTGRRRTPTPVPT
jgi:diacylglycerol O-acyltransferase / wax synthase